MVFIITSESSLKNIQMFSCIFKNKAKCKIVILSVSINKVLHTQTISPTEQSFIEDTHYVAYPYTIIKECTAIQNKNQIAPSKTT